VCVCVCVYVANDSDINKAELGIPGRLDSLLADALTYEEHLLREKEKLRGRLGRLHDILGKVE